MSQKAAPRSASAWVGRYVRVALGVLALWALLTLIIVAEKPAGLQRIAVGEVASRNMYAPFDFVDQSVSPPRPIKQGQRLIQQGDVITADQAVLLETVTASRAAHQHMRWLLGVMLAVAVLLGIGWWLWRALDARTARQPWRALVIATLLVGTLLLAKATQWSPLPSLAMPFSVGPLLTALLVTLPSAMLLTLIAAPLLALMLGEHALIAVALAAAAVAGSLAVRKARHRGQLLRAGLWIGVVYTIGLGMLSLVTDHPLRNTDLAWALGNGVASGIIVMGLLPVFEHAFQLTTDIRLLELADLNHPLLKELVLKAPGTYHHSLIVGNLAEAACETIGANALLARVGSYFHDIGKMEQAEYFIENQQQSGDYIHNQLTPAMSGLIITNHVRRGVMLAKKAKLPQAIIDFIPQHHGTGLVFYFYHKAMEKYDEGELAESDFRYEGPKPQSRETAVALLADGVEASCRALTDPTPTRIRGLVRKIINARFIDGQLDECDLTLRDLTKLEEVFTRVLLGIHHTRIQYPDADDDHADSHQQLAAPPPDSSAARGPHSRSHA